MKNKKILIGVISISLVLIISIILLISNNNTSNIVSSKKPIVDNSFLTLMIEQSDGTYQESTSNTWPGDGYIFNKELSACQNGGELDYDSNTNKVILYNNKSDGCYIYFDIYTKPVIDSINLVETTNNSITINISTTTGTNPITNYYYIINNNTPVSTTSNSHTFSGLDSGTTYNIEVYVIDSLGYESNRATLSVETSNPPSTLADACSNGENLASCITSFYNQSGTNITNIYYHNSSLANGAGDNSYRYSGANPNNYVCFGSDASTCPSENLYRIIGVFGSEVKLIKNTSLGNYFWSGSASIRSNSWSSSTLNTGILNGTYLSGLSTWQNKIATHIWKVGEMTSGNGTSKPKTVYNYEVGSNSSSTTVSKKIGLMYVSDYGFAASQSAWTTNIGDYHNSSITSNNWMYMGLFEWTISNGSDNSYIAFVVTSTGYVSNGFVSRDFNDVRPVFYLNSNVTYASGTGTSSNPIRIT